MSNGEKNITINISSMAIIKIILILLLLVMLYLLKDVILILLISIILAWSLNSWVNALQRRKVPRVLATAFIYIAVFGVFVIILALLIPPMAKQINEISKNLPTYYNRIISDFQRFKEFSIQQGFLNNLQSSLQSLQTNLTQTTAGVFNTIVSIFGGFLSFIGVLVITFYILIEENALKKFVRSITPVKYQPYIFQLMNRAQERLRLWLKGQLILCLIIGVFAWIGLMIGGVKYALVLALWAGLTEFIPYLGPLLGGIPAVFIALTTSGFPQAIFVVALYIIIQQIENHILVPKVMEKTAGLNPLVVIIVILIGAKIAGILGIILAVPVALIIKVFTEDFFIGKAKAEQ